MERTVASAIPHSLRRPVVFATVALALLLIAMNVTVAVVALPQIAEGVNASLVWVGWVVTSYQLANAISMPLAGRIADRFGRKRVYLVAMALFTVCSLAAGLSTNIVAVIIFRVGMGAGGGAFLPAAAGIVGDLYPERRAQMIGLFSSIFPIGAILGPTLGGFLVQQLSWRWAFLMNVPLAALALGLSWVLVSESSRRAVRPLDMRGAALLVGGLLSFMLSLTLAGGRYASVPWGVIAGLLVLAVVLLVAFWRHENSASDPIVDVALLRMRAFAASNAFNFLFGAAVMGLFSFMPLYTVAAYGFSTFESGAALSGRGVTMIIASIFTSALLLGKSSYRLPLAMGVLLTAAGFVPLGFMLPEFSVLGLHVSHFWLLMAVMSLGGFGMGMANPASNNAGIELLPSRIAAITGLRGMFRSTGGLVSTTFIFFLLGIAGDDASLLRWIFLTVGLLMPVLVLLVGMMPTGREASLEPPRQG